jgi:hypothetical protein
MPAPPLQMLPSLTSTAEHSYDRVHPFWYIMQYFTVIKQPGPTIEPLTVVGTGRQILLFNNMGVMYAPLPDTSTGTSTFLNLYIDALSFTS